MWEPADDFELQLALDSVRLYRSAFAYEAMVIGVHCKGSRVSKALTAAAEVQIARMNSIARGDDALSGVGTVIGDDAFALGVEATRLASLFREEREPLEALLEHKSFPANRRVIVGEQVLRLIYAGDGHVRSAYGYMPSHQLDFYLAQAGAQVPFTRAVWKTQVLAAVRTDD